VEVDLARTAVLHLLSVQFIAVWISSYIQHWLPGQTIVFICLNFLFCHCHFHYQIGNLGKIRVINKECVLDKVNGQYWQSSHLGSMSKTQVSSHGKQSLREVGCHVTNIDCKQTLLHQILWFNFCPFEKVLILPLCKNIWI